MDKDKPTPAGIAYGFFQAIGHKQFNGEKKQVLIFWRDDFYLWNGSVYQKVNKNDLTAFLVKFAAKNHVEASTKLIENIRLNLKAQANIPYGRLLNTWLTDKEPNKTVEAIVLNNWILTFMPDGTITKSAKTPDFFTINKLPYDFDENAKCTRWLQFMEEITSGDKELQELLQMWAGYLLMPTQEYQCFLLCIGEAAAGKSTFARAMKNMLGRNNCSDLPLRRFGNNFSLYMTFGKKLNVAGDAEQELTPQIEAVIKTWTGADGLDFERKWGDAFTAEATAKLMVLCNDFPNFTDKSMGTWRRLKVVPFVRNTAEVDPDLDAKLEAEMPGILNWAIMGMMKLKANGGFCKPEASEAVWRRFKEESNPAGMYLRENYYYDSTYPLGVRTETVYKIYRIWCREKGYQPMSDRTFGKEVLRAFPQTAKRRIGGREYRHYVYEGLKFQVGAEVQGYLTKPKLKEK
ncbi:MAG: phage/plasmid primase, P4 family [Candidatus Bathyarchaeota archaeon]|jgi:putative DNA primase/helicase